MHSCGRFQHLVDEYLDLDSILAVDFGQSDMNDVEDIYRKASAVNIPLLRIFVAAEELISGSIIEKYPTGVSLIYQSPSIKDARSVMTAYRDATGR